MRIDSVAYANKPTNVEAGLISNSILRQPNLTSSINELAEFISKGYSVVLDEFTGARRQENFIRTNLIGIDMDEVDADFYETARQLEKHGFKWSMRYKSYSYSDEHQKHRYILKFDEYLTRTEALKVYAYLETFLNIDKNTTSNLTRLWFATNHKIEPEDRPGSENNKQHVFTYVIPDTILVREEGVEYDERREFDFVIVNPKFEVYEELVEQDFANWEYEHIRKGVYCAAVVIMIQTGDDSYINHFFDSLENHWVKTWRKYYRHDLVNQKVYTKEAMRIVNKIGTIVPDKITNIFDILQDVDMIDLKSDEFIKPDDMFDLECGTNLLVAPAGSGKTSAIIELSEQSCDYLRVLCVPTIAICQQLEYKYSNHERFAFLHSDRDGSGTSLDDSRKYDLVVTTYDAYTTNSFGRHVLYIDEAHELLAFHAIAGKASVVEYILDTLDRPLATIFVTATPFNLPDVFDRKVFYRKDTNKNVKLTVVEDLNAAIHDIVHANLGKKVLIYRNSNNKIQRIREYMEIHSPHILTDVISAKDRDVSYQELLNDSELTADVVFATKFLNIGFDINDKFDIIIYADQSVRANDLLQLFNRERQKAEFICLTKNEVDSQGFNVNTGYKWFRELINRDLSDYDKYKLDRKYINGTVNKYLITHYEHYQHAKLSIKHVKQLFETFYPNFSAELEYHQQPNLYKEDRGNTLRDFCEYYVSEHEGRSRIEHDFMLFLADCQVDFKLDLTDPNSDIYSKPVRSKVYQVFHTIYRNLDECIERGYIKISDCGNYYNFLLEPESSYKLSDGNKINSFENAKIKDNLKVLLGIDELYPEDRDTLINKFNMNNIAFDNKPWNPKNFVKRCENLGVFFKSKQQRIDGERVYVLYNETIVLGKR